VGRPDLGGAGAAEDIFESLRRVLRPLDDGVEVYPGHGAGSACGRAMSSKTASTIGFERRFNPAFRYDSRPAFVEFLMDGVPPKPAAFETIVAKNRGLLPLVSAKPRPYTAREAWEAMQDGAVMLDLREPAVHGEAHAAGALNVWIDSPQFAERVAGFVPAGARLLLTPSAPSDVERAVQALSRVGIDEIAGYVQWGMIDWRDAGLPVDTVAQITVHDLATWHEQEQDVVVVDVREPLEWLDGHIAGAVHLPMLEAVRRAAELPANRPKAVVCAGGLRSSTTISALKRLVPGPWFNVAGGMSAWLKAGYSVRRPSPAPRT
jgi:hydroxyacylglutathione hydrolase